MSDFAGNGPSIPESILSEAKRFFSAATISQALKILSEAKASLSFKKGDPETYFIVSGIVKDDRTHECKLTYKKRFEGTETLPLQSNCDCHKWSETGHCPHTASLFFIFYLQRYLNEREIPESETSTPPISVGGSFGVNASEYGTIIRGPQYLMGAPGNPTYSSLQYLLHNQKVINFPLPVNFEGKIIISLSGQYVGKTLDVSEEYKPLFTFSYLNADGQEIREISLFEALYLFNWKDGIVYHLSSELKDLIQKIRIHQHSLTIDRFLALFEEYRDSRYVEIRIDDVLFNEIPKETPSLKVMFEPSDDKNQINMKISFARVDGSNSPLPVYLRSFVFEGGELGSFKKKKDAYDFIRSLTRDQTHIGENYKQLLASNNRRSYWLELIQKNEMGGSSLQYDPLKKGLTEIDKSFEKLVLKCVYDYFGEGVFRFSKYDGDIHELNFVMNSSTLFSGLSMFHDKLAPYGVTVFYDRNEIAKWSSRIRFERKLSTTKWFDLELAIDSKDLEIIKKIDLDQGVALTSQGLVLLRQDQKELLRFMKKYIKYEGEEVQNNDSDEATPNEKRFVLPFSRTRIFELFELRKLGIEGALTEEEIKFCEKLMTLESLPEYDLPDTLTGVLRPYQVTGYNWLRFLHENRLGACLADDMGLGKTLQTISFLVSIIEKVDKVLIVCPVSILINWEKEFEKFSNIPVHIYHGGERHLPDNAKIILTSYGVMKKEAEQSFAEMNFDVLVLDEVQHLKNIRSLGSYSIRTIKADFRICLTGTPVENDLAEFYNILDLAVPGIWGDLQFIRSTSNSKTRLLARKTAGPFILRRTKGQVLTDLPPKIENNVYLSFQDEELAFYKNTLINIRQKINAAKSKSKYGEILRGLLALRQTCLWQKTPAGLRSSKIDFLMETLEQIMEEGHQAIVFSQFTTYLDMIQNIMHEKHWKLSRIDGSQNVKKRQQEVEKFQEGKSQVFLISLKAGGVGLNLTAASYVFVMDPWWNPAVEQQAIDRAHRIGQKNTLTVYRPIIKSSVEEKVLELQQKKKELFLELLPENTPENDEQYFSGKLSMKDFEHLFNSDVLSPEESNEDIFDVSNFQDN